MSGTTDSAWERAQRTDQLFRACQDGDTAQVEDLLGEAQASPDVIRSRMKENPKKHGIVKEKDVDLVVQRFEEEYERSLFKNKFIVDTGTKTPSESMAEFAEKYEPYITDADRIKMLVQKAKKKGDWT